MNGDLFDIIYSMQYKFVPMNEKYAYEIACNWEYSGIYSFYDMTADKDNWHGEYFGVLNEDNQLVGFYPFSFDDHIMGIGFGLKPELTGKGIGKKYYYI